MDDDLRPREGSANLLFHPIGNGMGMDQRQMVFQLKSDFYE
jgi:hypothetical protein